MNTNLLDLNNDVLNIIGDYVKKDNFERKIMKEKQILNGKEIRFVYIHFGISMVLKMETLIQNIFFLNIYFIKLIMILNI